MEYGNQLICILMNIHLNVFFFWGGGEKSIYKKKLESKHISAYVKYRLTRLVPNENIAIAL